MKLVLVLMMVASVAFASPQVEESSGPVQIGLHDQDRPVEGLGMYYADVLFGEWQHEVDFRWYPADADAALAMIQTEVNTGTAPDIYSDYMGRVNRYANAKYAVDLTDLVDTSGFDPSFLEMTTKDGRVWALPETAWVMVWLVNVDLLEAVGMELTGNTWTMEEFMEASRRVVELEGDYYGFGLFAAGGTAGDYWNMALLPSFGASLYRNNEIVIGEPEGVRALEWYQDYVEEGLALPGAAGLTYAAMLEAWAQGRLLAINGGAQRMDSGRTNYEAGNAEIPYRVAMVSAPLTEGVEKAPLAVGPDAAMMFRNGTVRDEVVETLEYITGPYAQGVRTAYQARVPSLKAVDEVVAEAIPDYYAQSIELLREHGAWDIGLGLSEYARVRVLVPELFQRVYSGQDVREAIAEFEAEAGAILGE